MSNISPEDQVFWHLAPGLEKMTAMLTDLEQVITKESQKAIATLAAEIRQNMQSQLQDVMVTQKAGMAVMPDGANFLKVLTTMRDKREAEVKAVMPDSKTRQLDLAALQAQGKLPDPLQPYLETIKKPDEDIADWLKRLEALLVVSAEFKEKIATTLQRYEQDILPQLKLASLRQKLMDMITTLKKTDSRKISEEPKAFFSLVLDLYATLEQIFATLPDNEYLKQVGVLYKRIAVLLTKEISPPELKEKESETVEKAKPVRGKKSKIKEETGDKPAETRVVFNEGNRSKIEALLTDIPSGLEEFNKQWVPAVVSLLGLKGKKEFLEKILDPLNLSPKTRGYFLVYGDPKRYKCPSEEEKEKIREGIRKFIILIT